MLPLVRLCGEHLPESWVLMEQNKRYRNRLFFENRNIITDAHSFITDTILIPRTKYPVSQLPKVTNVVFGVYVVLFVLTGVFMSSLGRTEVTGG